MLERGNFPITFSVDGDFDNEKFLKLRLKVCHDARSLHNTKFKTDALDDAKSTISNIPILAHIVDGDDGLPDIGEHDFVIERDKFDDTKYRQIYLEQPVGVIPETNNYEVVDEDGIRYVYCDGYIWKGYSNYCIDILENSDRIKLSMEVDFLDYNYSRADDCYMINKYKYLGITLLGGDNRPAMQNSGATIVNYSDADNQLGIVSVEEMCSEITNIFSANTKVSEKGEIKMNADTINAVLAEFGISESELDFAIKEDMSESELREKVQAFVDSKGAVNSVSEPVADSVANDSADFSANDSTDVSADTSTDSSGSFSADEPVDSDVADDNTKSCSAENHTVTFSMSDEDKRAKIYCALRDVSDDEYWIMQTFDEYVYAQSFMDDKFYKIGFTKENDEIKINPEFTEVFSMFVTAEEKSEIENMRANYTALETEVNELREYKSDIEKTERQTALDELFATFDEKLSECEEYSAIKEDNSKYSVVEIEEKCYAMLGRIHSNFSVGNSDISTNRVSFSYHADNTDVNRAVYGGLFDAFK